MLYKLTVKRQPDLCLLLLLSGPFQTTQAFPEISFSETPFVEFFWGANPIKNQPFFWSIEASTVKRIVPLVELIRQASRRFLFSSSFPLWRSPLQTLKTPKAVHTKKVPNNIFSNVLWILWILFSRLLKSEGNYFFKSLRTVCQFLSDLIGNDSASIEIILFSL